MIFPADTHTTGIEERVDSFREKLAATSDDMLIVRQDVLHGSSFALEDADVFSLAQEISAQFGVHPNRDIYLVGSAKLGFSISPRKRWRHFGDNSDIDVAVVSERLFEKFWEEIDIYIKRPTSWADKERCSKYLASGWMRPDYLPGPIIDEWFEFFRVLQREHRYGNGIKIKAGLYYNMSFLERYQATGVEKCRGGGTN